MIDQELKKKIVNTISQYEHKCDKMQSQINTLRSVINQLIINPIGINYELDDRLSQLRNYLDTEFEPAVIEKKVKRLAEILSKMQRKKAENSRLVNGLIKQGVESIGRIANKSQDKRAVTKLQKMLDTEMESHAILIRFNQVLTQCISSVIKEMEELPQITKVDTPQKSYQSEISLKVNDSLQQLLNHLSIPQDLDSKRGVIKTNLEHALTDEELSTIIDNLTELVVESFNVEQNRFKGFLQQLTDQLNDFEIYLRVSGDARKKASEDSRLLECGIQDNLDQIKNHLDTSKTIEELSSKVSQNIKMIGDRLKEYRHNEKIREEEYAKQVSELQARLQESEQNAEEIKNLLAFQKYRINHDSLTGLPNRESYDEHILDSFQRWKRSSSALSLAVCDIDHFKRINDNFGHLAGDKVLKKVAMIFKSSIRTVDFIARIGGEEFVFIFEQTSSKEAFGILEKLRKSVEDCLFYYRDKKVDVTVSFGLTTVTKEDDIESLFMRADNAMYKAKNAGRNRVEIL
ncbi:TPA: GGDEF domain-containing protein [Legionella pneumophila]|uniref:GGDEF domain-containing protein n=1 Tax=Legionella pneumophila TaxID=446 RepID=UPI00026D9F73|nr:GGDEF domain-containing protein [Legionella pneumophila]UKW26756.1 GGDEF domain-containing protein [Legionella pneumophila]CCD08068.1 Diguanylate kinase [Legionella pneumophila subsp. pneumophila]CZH73708.1 Stalked cell differentiation-controlling protein [Legionella pneumophila]STX70571.1 diguanylate cyclase [Legionella pneumophila]HAT9214457.1 diguanylate cyclase [Legionella pneumophila subsp. pneumophila]